MRKFLRLLFAGILIWSIQPAARAQERLTAAALDYRFDGKYGQVEVGSPFVGAEFHESRPLPSRISFYYPVANSIDLSTDYWKRGASLPFAVGLQIDQEPRRWIGREPWSYTVSPHRAVFEREDPGWKFSMRYEFCLHEPAMVRSIRIRNRTPQSHAVVLYTHLKPALRTCQTYARIDSGRSVYLQATSASAITVQESSAAGATVLLQDVGMKPTRVSFDAEALAPTDSGTSRWLSLSEELPIGKSDNIRRASIIAAEYRVTLGPGDSMTVVQIIASCRNGEAEGLSGRLASSWKGEIASYDEKVMRESLGDSEFRTGDLAMDASAVWAKGILAANAHYLDGAVVPMPCPAEYNFFFTHDVLLTDLAAVMFDLPRVQRDLLYIVSHAKDTIIPHAYYWRDDGYKTEYCTSDNWNHFWFILATGAYLRHSLDSVTGAALYPFVTKSLGEILTQIKPDHLMYAFRPDWWDIGHLEGSRSYMTALAIRALREYLFISSFLSRPDGRLTAYEALADSMQNALTTVLWDGGRGYLMNYNGGREDTHYYMGSLLAAVFGELDGDRRAELLETARRELVDTAIGMRMAMPADFNSPTSIQYYKFAGEEAGKPYAYINGGVWPHGNAWYALALIAAGREAEALAFVRRTMTLDGVVNSPSGQPAMYEYRFADRSSAEFGMVDKPSFLWAGGFYLKTMYALYGVRENEWNISIAGDLPASPDSARYTLAFGKNNAVSLLSRGTHLAVMTYDGVEVPSSVLPIDISGSAHHIRCLYDTAGRTSLRSVNAIVRTVRRGKSGELRLTLSSFKGHNTVIAVDGPVRPGRVLVDGKSVQDVKPNRSRGVVTGYTIGYTAKVRDQHVIIEPGIRK